MTAQRGPLGPTDAELVGRVLAADREAFAVVYDRYGPRLFDFAYSMLRHREDAADAVADSFVLFAERLTQLREPDRLRPWLYAIVRTECLRRLKARKRVAYDAEEQLIEMADDTTGPEAAAEQSAQDAYLRQLVWDASAGLADRDRALLDLHLRQGLEGAELGEAIGVSANNAYVMLSRLRTQVDRSLGALLIARLGRDDCEDLDDLLADWDGGFSPLVRKRVARHVDQCAVCSERRHRMVSPMALLAAIPLVAAPVGLRDRVLRDTELVAYVTPADGKPGAPPPRGPRRRTGSALVIAAAFLLALALGGAAALEFGSSRQDTAAADGQIAVPPPTTLAPTAPLSPLPTPTPTPSASTPSPSATPSPTPSASTTPTPPPQPGALTVSARRVDLGATRTKRTVRLSNTGDLPVQYQASADVGWLDLSPGSAELGGGQSTDLVISADRSGLAEGTHTGKVTVTWDRGTATIRVSIDVEHAPQIGAFRFTATQGCGTAHALTQVTDESTLSSVTLVWSTPYSSGSTPMKQSGTLWSADVYTYTSSVDITAHVRATDARGNTTNSKPITIHVIGCPA